MPNYLYFPRGLIASWIDPLDVEQLRHAMPDQTYRRYFLNEMTGSEEEFVSLSAWDACADASLLQPLPDERERNEPRVLAIDAGLKSDCFAIISVARDPKRPADSIVIRTVKIWTPEPGYPVDFELHVKPWLAEYCHDHKVACISFDSYQLSFVMAQFGRDYSVWVEEFSQQKARAVADVDLLRAIHEKRIRHDGNAELRAHISNAMLKVGAQSDSMGRIVKKSPSAKVDGAVALSMAASTALRLYLSNAEPPRPVDGSDPTATWDERHRQLAASGAADAYLWR